jgi:DNA-binding PadR family transcriptional regulator
MSIEIREPTFLVLAALASGQKHGYAIIQEVEALSGGHTVLRPGSLYTTLDRLAHEGFIETAGEEVVAGRLRRYYRLNERGTRLLAAESERRVAVSKEALKRLRIAGSLA